MGTLPSLDHNQNRNGDKSVYVTPAQSLMVARIGSEMVPTQIEEILEENHEPVHKLWELDTIGI